MLWLKELKRGGSCAVTQAPTFFRADFIGVMQMLLFLLSDSEIELQ